MFRVICAADPAPRTIPQNQFGLLGVIDASPTRRRNASCSVASSTAASWLQRRPGTPIPATPGAEGAGPSATATTTRVGNEKFYSTSALFATGPAVKAIDEEERAVMLFVERGAPGLRIVDDWSGFGQRTTASGTVLLEVPVAGDMLIHNGLLAEIPTSRAPSRN